LGTASVLLDEPALRARDPEAVRRLQDRLVVAALARVARQHPVYRRTLAPFASEVRGVRDLDRLPLTTKDDLLADPDGYRLEPDPSEPLDYVLWDVAYTAGTSSGSPTPIVQTSFDLRGILLAQRRMAAIRRIGPDDVVLNLYPLGPFPHGGWIRPTQAAAVIGAPVIVGMSGSSAGDVFGVTRRVAEIARLPALPTVSVLWGVPSFVLRFLESVREEGVRLPRLRVIAVSGEPCRAGLRRALAEAAAEVGATEGLTVSDSLGATELQFALVECQEGSGFHNPAPELVHVAAVDADGRQVGPDGRGRLVYTHLNRRGTVLMRYLVGDTASVTTDPCPACAWTGGTVTQLFGREGAFVKVRGMMISIDALHVAIDGIEGVRDHRIELARESPVPGAMDRLTIGIDARDPAVAPLLVERVTGVVRAVAGVTPEVRLLGGGDVWVPEERMKPVRFVDLRTED